MKAAAHVLPKLTAIAQEASEDDRRAVGVGVLHAAVNGGQWSLLKPLHDLGFQVDAARAGSKAVENLYDSLASLVARGDWPEIELIAPDLLLQESARKRVVEAIGLYLVIENIRHYSDHWLWPLTPPPLTPDPSRFRRSVGKPRQTAPGCFQLHSLEIRQASLT